jgi:mono/diheme cytochrome c family protein
MSPTTRTGAKEATPRGGRGSSPIRVLAATLALTLGAACERAPEPLGEKLADARSRFERVCSGCHPLEVPLRRHKSLSGWRATVAEMRNKGAVLTDAEAEEVARYLAQTRGR